MLSARREPGPAALMVAILDGTADLTGAACIGQAFIFDPPSLDETLAETTYRHRAAVGICTDCPALDRCRTWAATQPGDGQVRAGIAPTNPRRGRPRKEKGTPR